MSTKVDTIQKEQMQKALEAYKRDKNSVKEFYPCTQLLTQWLQTKEQK